MTGGPTLPAASNSIGVDGAVISSLLIWMSETAVQFWNAVGQIGDGILTLLDAVLIFGVVLYGMNKIKNRLEKGS